MGFSILIFLVALLYGAGALLVAIINVMEWSNWSRRSEHPKQTYARRVLMSPLWPLIAWTYFKRLVNDAKGVDK